MNRLDELYDNMLDEEPFNFKEANKPYIFELAKLYAEECIKGSFKKCVEEDGFYMTGEEGGTLKVIEIEDLINDKNIVLL